MYVTAAALRQNDRRNPRATLRAACWSLLEQGVVQVLFRRWEMGMRYGGIKLAKPPNYSAKHP